MGNESRFNFWGIMVVVLLVWLLYFNSMIKLSLPLPPSVNHSHITTRAGKRIRSSETKIYMKNVRWDLSAKYFSDDAVLPLFDSSVKLYLDLWFFLPDHRRRDTHNSLKILLDTLQSIYYADDKMVLP